MVHTEQSISCVCSAVHVDAGMCVLWFAVLSRSHHGCHCVGPAGFVGLTAVGLFFCHGDSRDKVDEAIAIALRWYWRYLRAIVVKAFPEVFKAFDDAVLLASETIF